MKDLYLENERLKEVVERGRKRIKALTEELDEYKKKRDAEKKYVVEILDEAFNKKTDAIKRHCIYQKHFCDGTPNPSQTRAEDVLPICPKYDICALRKNPIIPKLDKKADM